MGCPPPDLVGVCPSPCEDAEPGTACPPCPALTVTGFGCDLAAFLTELWTLMGEGAQRALKVLDGPDL